VRQHDRERSIVADRANVAEMVGHAFEFGHQRAQMDCTQWDFDF
jgi:hypothetical protein